MAGEDGVEGFHFRVRGENGVARLVASLHQVDVVHGVALQSFKLQLTVHIGLEPALGMEGVVLSIVLLVYSLIDLETGWQFGILLTAHVQ